MKYVLLLCVLLLAVNAFATKVLHSKDMELHIHYGLNVHGTRSLLSEAEFLEVQRALTHHRAMYPESEELLEALQTVKTYSIGVLDANARMPLSESEFSLIERLKATDQPISVDELARQLKVSPDGVVATVRGLNARSEKKLRRSLVLSNGSTFWVEKDIPDYSDVDFEFPSNRPGVIYRNRYVGLSPKQTDLLKLISGSRGGFAPYSLIGEKMGWSRKGTARNSQNYVREINHRAIVQSGAPLIKSIHGKGYELALDQTPSTMAPPESFQLGEVSFSLEGQERLVFEKLNLAAVATERTLKISSAELVSVGLSVADLGEVLAKINRHFMEAGAERPLIRQYTVEFPDVAYTAFYSEARGHFNSPQRRFSSCERYLTI